MSEPGERAGATDDRIERRAEAKRRRLAARRRRLALGLVAAAALATGVVAGAGNGGDAASQPAATVTQSKLPRGGRSVLPEHRLVAFYGAPQSDELGALGIGAPADAAGRLLDQAREYRGKRPVLPVLELIVTVAAAAPGDDGDYVLRESDAVIRRYLAEARRRRALLVLDIQPGRADFAGEIARLRPYLRQPDVGLALDPEWHVGPDQVPGQVIGSVEASAVNEISAELSNMVRELDLPEKLLVIHQFTPGMIAGDQPLRDRPGLATVVNVDGFGDPPNKIAKYRQLHPDRESGLASGFKLFYNEDTGLMSPDQVLALHPKPDLIVYE